MSLVDQVVVFLGAAVVVVPLFNRLGLGSVLGYLSVGLGLGPWGLGLVEDAQAVLHFAELGVVLLLFIIGLELQPSRLWVLRKAVFGLGGAQVVVTTLLLTGLGVLFALPLGAALAVAMALALSSTAFVLQTLAEKGQLTTTHGRAAFAVLLFQDLAVVPMLVIVALLGPDSGAVNESPLAAIAKVVGVFATVIVGGHYGLRPALRFVASHASHEVFVGLALLIVLGVATTMHHIGLSMAMGAFLAGVLLADSEYRHQLEADIEPFKGLLLGLFFIAVGMSANLGIAIEQPFTVLALALALFAVKGVVLYAVARVSGRGNAAAIGLAMDLAQGGEFAFVLLGTAVAAQVVAPGLNELVVVVVTVSMALSPVLFQVNDRLVQPRFRRSVAVEFDTIAETGNRVIVAGFGRFGQIVGRLLNVRGVPYTALELSPAQVDVVRRFGGKIYFGDASRRDLLAAAGAAQARLIVVAVDDVATSLRIVEQVKTHYPHLQIFARARNRKHAHLLMDQQVQHIERETLHSSLQLTVDVLEALGTDRATAEHLAETFRVHDEATLAAQQAVHHDEQHLVQTSQEAARELEEILQRDRETDSTGP